MLLYHTHCTRFLAHNLLAYIDSQAEVARLMGQGYTHKSIEGQILYSIRLIGKLQLAALGAGHDPEFIGVNVTNKTVNGSQGRISFSSNSTSTFSF